MFEPKIKDSNKDRTNYKYDLPENIYMLGVSDSHKVISTIQELPEAVVRDGAKKCEDCQESDIKHAHNDLLLVQASSLSPFRAV
jgi:hypothetical protein